METAYQKLIVQTTQDQYRILVETVLVFMIIHNKKRVGYSIFEC